MAAGSKLTPELVARLPLPGMVAPGSVSYSPDGLHVTYLYSERGDLTRDLWRMELRTGKCERWLSPPGKGVDGRNVGREEALRRERQRIEAAGITHYQWAENANTLLLPIQDVAYRWQDGVVTRVVERATDPQVSGDGRTVFFVRDGDLWAAAEAGAVQLTDDAQPGVTNGLAEFAAQEELDRQHGFWPSPDGRWVAFEKSDERNIPVYPIVHQATETPEVEEHRYPFAGRANALVTLGVVAATGGAVAWLDLGEERDIYLARVDWHPDGRLFAQVLSRDQRRLELRAYEPSTWSATSLLVEESPTWVNLHDDLRFIKGPGSSSGLLRPAAIAIFPFMLRMAPWCAG